VSLRAGEKIASLQILHQVNLSNFQFAKFSFAFGETADLSIEIWKAAPCRKSEGF